MDDAKRQPDLAPWTVLGSRVTFADRWLTIRSDDCATADGHRIGAYHVMESPDWVAVVALTPADEVLLVSQYRHGAAAIVTELPAGVIEAGDASPDAAASRELAEETGYAADRFVRLGWCHTNPARQDNRVHMVLAVDVAPSAARADDPTEVTAASLVPFADFVDAVSRGEPLQALHLAAVHRATAHVLRSRCRRFAALRAALGAALCGPAP